MAAGSGSNSDTPFMDLSNQFLICSLCFDQYVVPKVLPCQHTFCLGCLRSYVASRNFDHTLPCPLCKEAVIIPGNDVNNFKNNFFIVSLLHFVEDSQRAGTSSMNSSSARPESADTLPHACGACAEDSPLATFCQVCSLWLCSRCTKAHSRLPATSSHQLLTSEEVDSQCKSMTNMGQSMLAKLEQANTARFEFLLSQIQLLPDNIALVKRRIETAVEEAHKVIREKAGALLQRVERFQQDQDEVINHRLTEVEERRQELQQIQQLLDSINQVNDGFKNQNSVKQVERYISKTSAFDFSSNSDKIVNLAFNAFNSNLTEVKNLEMGQLRVISSSNNTLQFLRNRPVGLHKVVSLVERDYISALAINKFAEKFVVSNNQTILVFKPDSRVPNPFLKQPLEGRVRKPWGIAFCEEEKCVYVSEAGRYEGDGAVVAFSLDGKFQSALASFLTLPRGIAVHKDCIYVCDQIDKCVYIFNRQGKIMRVLKKTPDGQFLFNSPMFISVGRNGVIAVSDNCCAVKVFDKEFVLRFTYTSMLPESQFWDVHVMPDGTVVVCDWKHGLHKITPDFKHNGLIALEDGAILREPSALAALENGNSVYIGTCGGEIFSAI